MKRIINRLYISGVEECRDGTEELAVVHACKHPCFANEVGVVTVHHPNYLSKRDYYNLYLNLVDPPLPLFKLESFTHFLSFMDEQWANPSQWILIHCNQGQSRAPSLAMLFLGKRHWGSSTFEAARSTFERIYPEYNPSAGIERFLSDHWSEIDE